MREESRIFSFSWKEPRFTGGERRENVYHKRWQLCYSFLFVHPLDPEELDGNGPEVASIAEFRYLPDQVRRSKPTLSRGSSISTRTSPWSTDTQRGDPVVSS